MSSDSNQDSSSSSEFSTGSNYNPTEDLENNSDTSIELSDNDYDSPEEIVSNYQISLLIKNPVVLLKKVDCKTKMDKLKELSTLLKSVDSFSGATKNVKLDFDKFCNAVELINDVVKDDKSSNKLFMRLLKNKLYDSAYEIVRYKDFESWVQLKAALSMRFVQRRSQGVVASELVNFCQSKNADVRNYASKIQSLLDELNEICISNQGFQSAPIIQVYNENLALNSCQNGLRNPNLKTVVKSKNFSKLSDAIEKALDEEVSHKPMSNEVINCKFCGKKGHNEDHCFKKENNERNKKTEEPSTSLVQAYDSRASETKPKLFCVFCHKKGHVVQNCYKKQNQKKNVNNIDSKNENIQSMSVSTHSQLNVDATTNCSSVVTNSENYLRPEQEVLKTVRVDEI